MSGNGPVEPASDLRQVASALRQTYIALTQECDPLTRSSMQEALRSLAAPPTPRPDEPTGLGAVVEDAAGNRYLRCRTNDLAPWYAEKPGDESRPYRYYHDLDVVRVLSEGVTA